MNIGEYYRKKHLKIIKVLGLNIDINIITIIRTKKSSKDQIIIWLIKRLKSPFKLNGRHKKKRVAQGITSTWTESGKRRRKARKYYLEILKQINNLTEDQVNTIANFYIKKPTL